MAITIPDILNQWTAFGIYDYVLPFLLIFSVVFGILASTNILGKQKGVNVIVSIVVGLLALRLGIVSTFFTEVFPRLGIGIAVILSLLIMIGLFINSEEAKYWMYGIATIAVIAWIVILVGSFESVGWIGTYGGVMENYAGLIIGVVFLVGVIIAVVASGSTGGTGKFKRQVYHENEKE